MIGASETVKRATIGIAILVLLSKGIGFIREIVIAYKFGTGAEYDIYLIAISIPLALYELFYASFTNLMIPDYARAAAAEDRSAGMHRLWTEFNFSLVGAVLIMGLVIVAAPQLIRLIAPGMDVAYLTEAVFITRISSILIVVAVLGSYFQSVLNAEKRFLLPAASPIAANLVIIFTLVIFAGRLSTRALMYGVVGGYFMQAMVMFFPFRKIGMLKHFHARFIEPHIRKFAYSAVAILVIEAAAKLYAIIDRYFASFMESGVISALAYSYILMMLPVAIFAYALSTAIFPFFSDAFADRDEKKTGHLLDRGISVSLLVAVPAVAIYWIFAEKLVVVLFQRGAFDSRSVAYTTDLLKYFAWAFPGQFILYLMSRAYYAARRFDILLIQVAVMVGLKIALSAVGVKLFGSAGLPLATAVSYSVGAIILLMLANRVLARLDGRRLILYFSRVLAASLVMAASAVVLDRLFLGESLKGLQLMGGMALVIIVSMAVFVAVAYLAKIPEVVEIMRGVKSGK